LLAQGGPQGGPLPLTTQTIAFVTNVVWTGTDCIVFRRQARIAGVESIGPQYRGAPEV
jgi:hypothetical protein